MGERGRRDGVRGVRGCEKGLGVLEGVRGVRVRWGCRGCVTSYHVTSCLTHPPYTSPSAQDVRGVRVRVR